MAFHVFIDGLNLYKGALSKRPDLKWLDLIELSKELMGKYPPAFIYYFTSPMKRRFSGDLSPERQATYIRVLGHQGIRIIKGKTVRYQKWLRHTEFERERFVQPTFPRLFGVSDYLIRRVWKASLPDAPKSKVELLSEKASDVNLASYLLRDVFQGLMDQALVISGDSDLFMPIKFAVEAGITVKVVIPSQSQPLGIIQTVASEVAYLTREQLESSQLDRPFQTPKGSLIYPPDVWR